MAWSCQGQDTPTRPELTPPQQMTRFLWLKRVLRRLAEDVMGMDACADCHPDIVDAYKTTGMGRSLYRPNKISSSKTLAHRPQPKRTQK